MKVAAFFDVDETLINMKSMFHFLSFLCSKVNQEELEISLNYSNIISSIKTFAATHPRSEVNFLYYRYYEGLSREFVRQTAHEWYDGIDKEHDFFIHTVCEQLQWHKDRGDDVVFVSGTSNEILAPLAEALGATATLGANLECQNGMFTGRLILPQTIGQGKAEAICQYLWLNNIEAKNCYAYGDDISDRYMLEAVGHPNVVSGNAELEAWAKEFNYPIIKSASKTST